MIDSIMSPTDGWENLEKTSVLLLKISNRRFFVNNAISMSTRVTFTQYMFFV